MHPEHAQLLQRIVNFTVQQALIAYSEEIGRLDKDSSSLSKQQILRLLLVRDTVEQNLQEIEIASSEERAIALTVLSDLDSHLKKHAQALVKDDLLADCRQSRRPPETDWWWWLEPYCSKSSGHKLDRLDWLWNILSASCLVGSASFLTITAQAFSSVGGFDLLQSLSTISQATGLVLVASGTLTDKGQQLVKRTLEKLNIPTHFHAEATLGAAALLLLGSYGVYNSLPQLSQYYYQKGVTAQRRGNLYAAIEYFKEAIAFDQNYSAPHTHLAEVYQNLEKFEEAQAEYQDGLLKGDIAALNGMGTLILAASAEEEPEELGALSGLLDAEVLFRIGLNQVEPDNLYLQAALHTNLGITLMKQGKAAGDPDVDPKRLFEEAGEHFQSAIEIEQSLDAADLEQTDAGQGLAYCYLADLYEQTEKEEEAAENWRLCEESAYPASLEQYEDILRLGGNAIGLQLETKHILEPDL